MASKGCSQQEAWDTIEAKRGEATDDAIADAWTATVSEVQTETGREESAFLPVDWAKVRDVVVKDLDLK